jgi:hypothetical protein
MGNTSLLLVSRGSCSATLSNHSPLMKRNAPIIENLDLAPLCDAEAMHCYHVEYVGTRRSLRVRQH